VSDTTDNSESFGPSTKSIVGIAAVACVACCIGPILGWLGALAALGLGSTLFIGAAGLLVAGGAVAVFVVARRRLSSNVSCSVVPEQVAVELSRDRP
jgi:hypothetical protein